MTPGRPNLSFCEDFATRRHFPALDGLRGVSVLLVVAFHIRNEPLDWLHGANGVRVFFVLSGFLITTLCLREEAERGRVSLRAFFVRRSARILPLYFVALASYCVLVFWTQLDTRQETFRSALPYYLSFLQEIPLFQNIDRPFGVAWSLGIEEKFYLLWPLLAFATARTFALRMTAVVSLGGLFFLASLYWSPGRYVSPYADILIGCGLAIVLGRRTSCRRMAVLAQPPIATVAGLAVLAVMLWPAAIPKSLDLLLPVCVTLSLPGLVVGAGVFARLLGNRTLRWIGRVSYGIYLFHQLALKLAERLVPDGHGLVGDFGVLAIGLAVLLPTVALLSATVERPLIDWGHRVSRRLMSDTSRENVVANELRDSDRHGQ